MWLDFTAMHLKVSLRLVTGHTKVWVKDYSVLLQHSPKCNRQSLILADDYFLSRLPPIYLRLAEAGVRLAATLNRALG
ncbi:hypothetical protein EJ110_NYTH21733 [Nymphaea thermarum]|nr:hypothetical protein EJ110_NYTH21733 [Nymphaea thermarum]